MKILKVEKDKNIIELTHQDIKCVLIGLLSNKTTLEVTISLEEQLDNVVRSHSHIKTLINQIEKLTTEFSNLENKIWQKITEEDVMPKR